MAILSSQEMFYQAYEPKLQNRFLFSIDGIPAYLVRQADRPKLTFDEVTLDHINIKRKIKGKADWQNINATLYDPVTPSGAQAVMEWIRLSHESVTGRDGYSDFYKKDLTLNLLGPVGDIVSEWVLKGALITAATFGDFNYDNAEPSEISLTLALDYAVLNF